MIYFLVTIMAA